MTKRLNLIAAGFIRREDLDFSDDGSYFRGYEYGGMPVTVCKYDGEYYISIRRDYLKNSFTWEDWSKTEEYKLEGEFNGTSEVDIEKLKKNCIAIAKKIIELNNEVENEKIDTEPLKKSLLNEIEYSEEIINKFKKNYKWYERSSYELKSAIDYLKFAEGKLKKAKEVFENIDFESTYNLRKYKYELENCGYVFIRKNDYWLEELSKMLVA